MTSISLLVVSLLKFFILRRSVLIVYVFIRIYPFNLLHSHLSIATGGLKYLKSKEFGFILNKEPNR